MIYLSSDHAGFKRKNQIIEILKKKNIEYKDFGPFEYDALDDYPDYIYPCCLELSKNLGGNSAIIFGGSGQGEAIVANKIKNIRAVVYYGQNKEIIKLSKLHNNANVLSLGARFIEKEDLEEIINLWLNTKFENEERHLRRINKILELKK